MVEAHVTEVASAGGRGLYLLAIIAIIAIIVIIAGTLIVVEVFVKGKRRNRQSQKICPQCGKPVSEGKNFCTSCGAEIK